MRKLRKKFWGIFGVRRRTTTTKPSMAAATRSPRRRRSSQKTLGTKVRSNTVPVLRNIVRFVPYALVAAATAALPVFGYELYVDLMTSPHLALQSIEVVGCERVEGEEIRRSANVAVGENLLQLDEDAVEERLRWHPWIRKVDVVKHLPDRLTITIEEREPAAVLVGERTFLVDRDGTLFKEMSASEFDAELLVIAGVEATRLIRMGDERRMRSTLSEIMAVVREYKSLGLDAYYPVTEVHYDEVIGVALVAAGRQQFVLGLGDYPARLRRLGEVLAHLAKNGSGVSEIRLDNEKHPWKVAVGGSTIKFDSRRAVTTIPAASLEMLP
jgi:cell division protein FtsQ